VAAEGPRLIALALPVGATLAGIFSVAYSARFIHDVFFNGEPVGLTHTPHEPPRFMRVPVEILVVICLAVGVAPALTVGPLLAVAAGAALGGPLPDYSLALWHGFNLPLLMSVIALAGGLVLYFGLQRFVNLHRVVMLPRGGREAFLLFIDRSIGAARALTLALQNGSLQWYLLMLVLVAVVAGALPFLRGGTAGTVAPLTPVGPFAPAVLLMGAVCAIAAAVTYRRRLVALLFLGAVGLVVAWVFVYLSAPDLALTQVLVELVTVVLMMLALHWLPPASPREVRRARIALHACVAVAAGLGTAALAFMVMTRPLRFDCRVLPRQFSVAWGRGECGQRHHRRLPGLRYAGRDHGARYRCGHHRGAAGAGSEGHPACPCLATRARHWPDLADAGAGLAAADAIHRAGRGLPARARHNEPGGGFIAGLVLAIGLILQYVANGQRWTEERLRATSRRGWAAGC